MTKQTFKHYVSRIIGLQPFTFLLAVAVRIAVPKHRVGVALVGFDQDGRVFLLKHVFRPGTRWGLPGGWLHSGEDPAAGVLRELREETGLAAELRSVTYVSRESSPPHIGIAYTAAIQPGEIRLSNEILCAEWYDPGELPDTLLDFERAAISAALREREEDKARVRAGNE